MTIHSTRDKMPQVCVWSFRNNVPHTVSKGRSVSCLQIERENLHASGMEVLCLETFSMWPTRNEDHTSWRPLQHIFHTIQHQVDLANLIISNRSDFLGISSELLSPRAPHQLGGCWSLYSSKSLFEPFSELPKPKAKTWNIPILQVAEWDWVGQGRRQRFAEFPSVTRT